MYIEKRIKYVCEKVKLIKLFLDIAPCTHYFNSLSFGELKRTYFLS